MNKTRYILYTAIGIPVLFILMWTFAIPGDLLKDRIESTVAGSGGNSALALSIDGFRKGILFDLYADSLDLTMDDKPALRITGFRGNITPRYLPAALLAVEITGKIGTGSVDGVVKLPVQGEITIDGAELNAIPYITRFGLEINGHVSSEIRLKKEAFTIIFRVPDLNIDDSTSVIPLLHTFRRLQGALTIRGNDIMIDSVSLEGEKGYARLKGDIVQGRMNLSLELMPDEDKLSTTESMLIGRYIVSPGYYIIPLKKLL